MKKALLVIIFAAFSLFGIVLYSANSTNDNKLHLIICNVGQGDGILIRTPDGEDILIDGGPDNKILDCLSRNMPFWDKTIEAVFLTHPHADHLTGLIYVMDSYEIKDFYTEEVESKSQIYLALRKKIKEKNIVFHDIKTGDRLSEPSGVVLETLWPEMSALTNYDATDANLDLNGFSLIEVLKYKNFKALLTGDAGVLTEDKIAQTAGKITVLKVPHHGSKTGMSDNFLSEISPDLAVISVGLKNRYHHPSIVSLELLKNHNIRMLRTDRNGEVDITTDGVSWNFNSEK